MIPDPDWGDIWRFAARVDRVVDGDTLDLEADLGFRTFARVRIRLRGVDTAEVYGVRKESEEYARGQEHSAFTTHWVEYYQNGDPGYPFVLITEQESGKYGRWIADIWHRDSGESLTEALVCEFPEVEE